MNLTARDKTTWFEARDDQSFTTGKCWSLGEALERTLRHFAFPRDRNAPPVSIYEVEGRGGTASMTLILRCEDHDLVMKIGPVR